MGHLTPLSSDSLESYGGLIREGAQFLLAVAAVIAAFRSEKRARSAEASAAVAHVRATEAAREQLTFALKRAVRETKEARQEATGSSPLGEGGSV